MIIERGTEDLSQQDRASLLEELRRVKEINRALMDRVERSMDLQGDGAFTLFEAAISLETKVRERTAQLESTLRRLERSNVDLKVAKEAADAANRAKSKFLATMSHEIRTPMNGILATTELLCATDLSDRQQRAVVRVHRSAEALLNIINDILDFSRLEADRMDLEVVDFDLRDAIEGTVELLSEHAHQKGLELTCDIEPVLPNSASGDVNRICQILTNLVGNAVKFTNQGEISVRVGRHGRYGDEASTIRVEVIDTGIGLTQGVRDEVFKAFNQVENSSARRFGGSGLGLTISRRLVELMDGEIGVESAPGHGSTFWFTVPKAIDVAAGGLAESPLSTALSGRLILIIDDNQKTRESIARPLTAHGAVCCDVSGVEAVSGSVTGKCEAIDRPDVVILDAELPLESAAGTGSNPFAPPVILLQSPGHDATMPLLPNTIAGVLSKPVRQIELLETVAAAIVGGREQLDAAARPAVGFGIDSSERIGLDVLLAEDNEINRETAVDLLEFLGCTVRVAADGEQALDMIGRGTYDIVLMDCQMPRVDGYEATREVRKQEARDDTGRRIPIIALTGNAMHGDREHCLDVGMDDFLSKPYTLDTLQSLLKRWRDTIRNGVG